MISAIDLDGNGLEQPLKLRVVQGLERPREVAWEGDTRERRRRMSRRLEADEALSEIAPLIVMMHP